jgi:hypothetical protein
MRKKTIMFVLMLAVFLLATAQTNLVNLVTGVKGILRPINGGTGTSSAGTAGQILVSDGTNFQPADPLVSGNPTSSAQNATLAFTDPSLTGIESVKSSAANLYGWYIYNPNTTPCFVQLLDGASPVLGTTVPSPVLSLPPGPSAANVAPTVMAIKHFSSALSIAATTTPNGATPCALGLTVNLFYF